MRVTSFAFAFIAVFVSFVTSGLVGEAHGQGFVQQWTTTSQPDWTLGTVPTGSSATAAITAGSPGLLTLESTTGVSVGGAAAAVYFNSAVSFTASGTRVQAVINPNAISTTNRNVGILAYLDPVGLNGYGLTIDYDNGDLDLSRLTTGVASQIGSGVIPSFSATTTYEISLVISNSLLTATASSGGSSLLDFSASDSTYTTGFAGVIVNRDVGDPTLRGSFGTVTAAVPEPSTMALASMGLVAVAAAARSRRRTLARTRSSVCGE
jgi:hypothetical protein